jgi:DNA invertase Pin-like site-specific DNA recombinase
MKREAATSDRPVIRAVQYVRMSTEHQQYSVENQADVIRRYASANGMSIVRSYSDEGKSGLVLSGRTGLQELLQQVQTGKPDFDVILVYDVSRWGRFQDADEGIYYEYLCKKAQVPVHFCAELFPNDASLTTSVIKTIKRAMAGEYSRDLSVKVFAGQCRLIELGFRQGGPAGFGLRRQLIAQNGSPKGLLSRGEQKSIQTDRVILVPGPDDEVQMVREMFRRFTECGETEQQLAVLLNSRGVPTDFGRPWTRAAVRQVLTNPKYIGSNVFNRRSFKLKRKRVANPPIMWIRREGAFIPLVSPEQFALAQAIIQGRYSNYSDDEMLLALRKLLSSAGQLSGILIDETECMPSSSSYRARFGTLLRAYQLVGYTPARDFAYVAINKQLRGYYKEHIDRIVKSIERAGSIVSRDPVCDVLTINNEFTTSLILARCQQTQSGEYRWLLRLDASLDPDITVAARLKPGNDDVLDYYILPRVDKLIAHRLSDHNALDVDVYRFDDLQFFIDLASRVQIEEVA